MFRYWQYGKYDKPRNGKEIFLADGRFTELHVSSQFTHGKCLSIERNTCIAWSFHTCMSTFMVSASADTVVTIFMGRMMAYRVIN